MSSRSGALVEQGLQDKQIAVELGISVKTVEKHVGAVLRKTRSPNRTALAHRAAVRSIPERVGRGIPTRGRWGESTLAHRSGCA